MNVPEGNQKSKHMVNVMVVGEFLAVEWYNSEISIVITTIIHHNLIQSMASYHDLVKT